MDCVFSRRRTQLIELPTLSEIFSTISSNNVLGIYGNNSSSTIVSGSITRTTASSNGICYIFSVSNGYIRIYKVINRNIPTQASLKNNNPPSSESVGIYQTSVQWSNSTQDWGTYTFMSYGGTFALLSIPFSGNITESAVDSVLSNMTITRVAQRNDTYTARVETNDKTKSVYIAARANYIDFWVPSGTAYTRIGGTSTAAAMTQNGYLGFNGKVYGGSIIGLS